MRIPLAVQRSFRLSERTLALLDARARDTAESRNGLVERLLGEAVRTDRHPLVHFREAAGHRRAALVGTRLEVHQVLASLRASGNDIDDATKYLGVTSRQVRAAVEYYADFKDEVDAAAAEDQELEDRERERWERAQRVLG